MDMHNYCVWGGVGGSGGGGVGAEDGFSTEETRNGFIVAAD